MKIEGIISESDYLRSQYLHIKPHPILAVLGGIICALAAFVLIVAFSWVLLACALYFMLYFAVFIPWRVKKIYREYSAIKDPITVSIKDEGLEFTSPKGASVFPWSDIRKIKRNSSLILGYPNRSIFHLIPSHFFASKEEFHEFVELVKNKCPSVT